MRKSIHAPPRAQAMIEALRGLGYSPATALADIVDNSISAAADAVQIEFVWAAEDSYMAVSDNGSGMTRAELETAMRIGELSPLATREPGDLGRFGMGLKTASFSQARRLTVVSKKGGEISCLRWDLDIIAASEDDGWHLVEPDLEETVGRSGLDGWATGTVVAWEVLDRIVSPSFSEQDFLDLIDQVESHLAMTFHRFLEGSHPKLRLTINGRRVKPWDPFLTGHPATWSSPVERWGVGADAIEVRCHVLPHRDRLSDTEYRDAAGINGWTAHQGFYVYRNQRLLLAGSWLGLGHGRMWTKEEAHKLARIRLDIPNSADAEWKVDIRKSTARPPLALRNKLVLLAEDTRRRARLVFAHRAKTVQSARSVPKVQAWKAERLAGGLRYRIHREHPSVRAVMDRVDGDLKEQAEAMLRVIEETVPVQRIWLDTAAEQETPSNYFEGEAPEEVLRVLRVFYRNLVTHRGMSPQSAREQLLRTEPFDEFPRLIETLTEQPEE